MFLAGSELWGNDHVGMKLRRNGFQTGLKRASLVLIPALIPFSSPKSWRISLPQDILQMPSSWTRRALLLSLCRMHRWTKIWGRYVVPPRASEAGFSSCCAFSPAGLASPSPQPQSPSVPHPGTLHPGPTCSPDIIAPPHSHTAAQSRAAGISPHHRTRAHANIYGEDSHFFTNKLESI